MIIEDDKLKVIDLGSANGTYLNGERVDEALAGYCDAVRVVLHPDNSVTVSES